MEKKLAMHHIAAAWLLKDVIEIIHINIDAAISKISWINTDNKKIISKSKLRCGFSDSQ